VGFLVKGIGVKLEGSAKKPEEVKHEADVVKQSQEVL
jgi:hypothetical protein